MKSNPKQCIDLQLWVERCETQLDSCRELNWDQFENSKESPTNPAPHLKSTEVSKVIIPLQPLEIVSKNLCNTARVHFEAGLLQEETDVAQSLAIAQSNRHGQEQICKIYVNALKHHWFQQKKHIEIVLRKFTEANDKERWLTSMLRETTANLRLNENDANKLANEYRTVMKDHWPDWDIALQADPIDYANLSLLLKDMFVDEDQVIASQFEDETLIFAVSGCSGSQIQVPQTPPHHHPVGAVDHVGLAVSDLEASKSFFVDVLGFRVVKHITQYPAYILKNGLSTITLWKVTDPIHAISFDRKNNVGLHHLAFSVSSFAELDKLYEQISKYKNIEIEFAPELSYGGPAKHMMFREPSGNRLALVHRPK